MQEMVWRCSKTLKKCFVGVLDDGFTGKRTLMYKTLEITWMQVATKLVCISTYQHGCGTKSFCLSSSGGPGVVDSAVEHLSGTADI